MVAGVFIMASLGDRIGERVASRLLGGALCLSIDASDRRRGDLSALP